MYGATCAAAATAIYSSAASATIPLKSRCNYMHQSYARSCRYVGYMSSAKRSAHKRCAFEVYSAIGTVGMSTGITRELQMPQGL